MKTEDYGWACKGHWRAGEFGYYEALCNRPRGHAIVQHDSQVWLYDLRGILNRLRAFRAFLNYAWGARGASVRIEGRYPTYSIETEN